MAKDKHANLAKQFLKRYAASPGQMILEMADGLRTSINLESSLAHD
jgi:hypothetical protein